MYLKRFFFLKLSQIPSDLGLFNTNYNEIKLESGEIGEANKVFNSILITATTKLKNSPIDENNCLITPNEERKKCEHIVEHISKVFSVGYGLEREILSPWERCVSYEPEDETEKTHLIKATISEYEKYSAKFLGTPPLFEFDWQAAYSDRQHGLDLMADALNHKNSAGQFRDCVRLFENAFNLPTKQLRKKLLQFLNAELGYTSSEIDRWIELRDPLSHADNKKCEDIFYESDVTPVIQRVRQAAYDVLLNKKNWNINDAARRNIWSPGAYTQNREGHAATRAGAKNISVSIMDPYDVYPVILGIGLTHISENLFPRLNSDHSITTSNQCQAVGHATYSEK